MNIVSNISKNLSKIWIKIINLEKPPFPEIKEELGKLTSKEKKLIKILDFAQIEKTSH